MPSPTRTDLEVLIAARALIARPEDWCQGVRQIGRARCLASALSDAARNKPGAATAARHYLDVGLFTLGGWNDTHNHAQVLALFDRAIDAARAALASEPTS